MENHPHMPLEQFVTVSHYRSVNCIFCRIDLWLNLGSAVQNNIIGIPFSNALCTRYISFEWKI